MEKNESDSDQDLVDPNFLSKIVKCWSIFSCIKEKEVKELKSEKMEKAQDLELKENEKLKYVQNLSSKFIDIEKEKAKLDFEKKQASKFLDEFVASLQIDPLSEEYNMNHKKRGTCLIISHKTFYSNSLPDRRGTEKDANGLKVCFQNLGFDIKDYEDLTVCELKAILKAVAKADHSDEDCFACCIMTHGELDTLWAKDEKYYVESIFTPFKADNCTTLAGKPKLFFIQACRGDKVDPGVRLLMGKDVTDSNSLYYKIPTWADFLIAYSTIPGYFSWRNTLDGSWFIQSLIEVLTSEGSTTSLLELLTKVSYKVAYNYESNVPEGGLFDKQKQVPVINSMLTRRVILKRKLLSS